MTKRRRVVRPPNVDGHRAALRLLNHLLFAQLLDDLASAGRRVMAILPPERTLLDLCCGTGDLASPSPAPARQARNYRRRFCSRHGEAGARGKSQSVTPPRPPPGADGAAVRRESFDLFCRLWFSNPNYAADWANLP
jgi:hypothetical protein